MLHLTIRLKNPSPIPTNLHMHPSATASYHYNLRCQFLARDSIYAIARPCGVCPSVCPSDTRADQSKTVEDRIMQLSLWFPRG